MCLGLLKVIIQPREGPVGSRGKCVWIWGLIGRVGVHGLSVVILETIRETMCSFRDFPGAGDLRSA